MQRGAPTWSAHGQALSGKCCHTCRYDWIGDHNAPWQTDLNSQNSTIDWNKVGLPGSLPSLLPLSSVLPQGLVLLATQAYKCTLWSCAHCSCDD